MESTSSLFKKEDTGVIPNDSGVHRGGAGLPSHGPVVEKHTLKCPFGSQNVCISAHLGARKHVLNRYLGTPNVCWKEPARESRVPE